MLRVCVCMGGVEQLYRAWICALAADRVSCFISQAANLKMWKIIVFGSIFRTVFLNKVIFYRFWFYFSECHFPKP